MELFFPFVLIRMGGKMKSINDFFIMRMRMTSRRRIVRVMITRMIDYLIEEEFSNR